MLKNISKRESLMIGAAIFFVTAITLWVGVYEPAVEKKEMLKRKIEAKSKELIEVSALANKLAKQKNRIDRFEVRLRKDTFKGSLLAQMESLADKAGIRKNIASMAPSTVNEFDGYRESIVDIKMQKVSLPGIITFLKSVDTSPGIKRVKRLSIRPKYDDPSDLDVLISIANYSFSK